MAPPNYAGLQNALVLPNPNGMAAAPGLNMGMVGAAANQSVGNFDPSSFTSATELLQQHIKNQLQQGFAAGNHPFQQQQQGMIAAATSSPQVNAMAAQQQNNQLNGIGGSNNSDSASLGGETKNSNDASDNLEVIQQRMKERSELVRQLKEVMDGNTAGGPGRGGNPNNISIPTQNPTQQTKSETNDAPAPPNAVGNAFAGSSHAAAQYQHMIPAAAAVGNPQMQQMMNQFNPAASGLIPGMGAIGGALAGLGQFPNAAMMGGGMGMLGTGQLLAQPNFMGGGAGAPGVMTNPLTNPAAPGFQNFSLMAMQNPAVLAQLQAANQMGNFPGAVNLSFNQQVPDLGAKQSNQAGTATYKIP